MGERPAILVLNAGSSTLKFSLFDWAGRELLATGVADWGAAAAMLAVKRGGQAETRTSLAASDAGAAAARIVEELGHGHRAPTGQPSRIGAVGHRVVHGGARFTAAVRITPEVERAIGDLAELAPLHNPVSLRVIRAVERRLPGVPQVAAFDTAFHATLPEEARTYALPLKWTREWGLRRYGFHGLSHSWSAHRAAGMLGRDDLKLIVAHLGHGASISAVRNGACIDTSMGFTPLEGLVMGTRSGSVDPGLLMYLLREKGLDTERLDHALNGESGLLGLSGISGDMREVLDAAPTSRDARLAVEVYVHRARQTIGAMAAVLGGVDALVFTAGVGEHSAEIRSRICEPLGFLGIEIDAAANGACEPDCDIAAPGARARVLVVGAREDLAIVREVRRLIQTQKEATS